MIAAEVLLDHLVHIHARVNFCTQRNPPTGPRLYFVSDDDRPHWQMHLRDWLPPILAELRAAGYRTPAYLSFLDEEETADLINNRSVAQTARGLGRLLAAAVSEELLSPRSQRLAIAALMLFFHNTDRGRGLAEVVALNQVREELIPEAWRPLYRDLIYGRCELSLGDFDRELEALLDASNLEVEEEVEPEVEQETEEEPFVFRVSGQQWAFAYAGHAFQLDAMRGFRDIHRLLSKPGQAISVLELNRPDDQDCSAALQKTLGEVLDPEALELCRERLQHLVGEREEAERNGDEARLAAIDQETESISDQVDKATGLNGRIRDTSPEVEKARCNTTHGIRRAIKKIEEQNREFAQHLTDSIQTGRTCIYTPPSPAINWAL